MLSDISNIQKYFPDLTSDQLEKFNKLGPFYKEKNEQINVISRKDITALYIHHVLHSLSIAKFITFTPGSMILDLGTGGGFPGIPLAIMFPEVNFLLIDGKRKKISVVNDAIDFFDLKNVKALHKRSEEVKYKFDFVLARAVTRLDKLIPLCLPLVSNNHINVIPNGIIGLKGGDLTEEIKEVSQWHQVETTPVNKFFEEPYFEEKYVFYIQA
ncbi:MAG: 16S rRNA (guanine(527)-N(7))-methyltransferase RsmG [Saprospiraceae bacterium]|nr:16S rRNA (guanine(527)-N(7))-methyltransferase RsmG [Bacteroidia bacterium]NNE13428.1 16S rRNA (guanine(527)-N(7))-methyltransferase RsmG [Saprospiraceae bacterium]NNL93797.1 16S rRNA (guanine(527)-N(7))-methyltransferase RsmG [Saprospiraceae bacterium]